MSILKITRKDGKKLTKQDKQNLIEITRSISNHFGYESFEYKFMETYKTIFDICDLNVEEVKDTIQSEETNAIFIDEVPQFDNNLWDKIRRRILNDKNNS